MSELENLDCMEIADLHAYCQDPSAPPLLREYAACKARAMENRLAGLMQCARLWEDTADRLYQRLPSELRW